MCVCCACVYVSKGGCECWWVGICVYVGVDVCVTCSILHPPEDPALKAFHSASSPTTWRNTLDLSSFDGGDDDGVDDDLDGGTWMDDFMGGSSDDDAWHWLNFLVSVDKEYLSMPLLLLLSLSSLFLLTSLVWLTMEWLTSTQCSSTSTLLLLPTMLSVLSTTAAILWCCRRSIPSNELA